MPDQVRDTKNGITNKEYISTKTLNGYRTEIRNAIKQHISNKNIVDEFAIEGYKFKPFKIKRSTEKLREDVIELFGLQSIIGLIERLLRFKGRVLKYSTFFIFSTLYVFIGKH